MIRAAQGSVRAQRNDDVGARHRQLMLAAAAALRWRSTAPKLCRQWRCAAVASGVRSCLNLNSTAFRLPAITRVARVGCFKSLAVVMQTTGMQRVFKASCRTSTTALRRIVSQAGSQGPALPPPIARLASQQRSGSGAAASNGLPGALC